MCRNIYDKSFNEDKSNIVKITRNVEGCEKQLIGEKKKN